MFFHRKLRVALQPLLDAAHQDREQVAMTNHLLIFGMGYTASRLAASLASDGWEVTGIRRMGGDGVVAFDDEHAVHAALANATHILSSIPPAPDTGDSALLRYGRAIASAPAIWVGYLSSTGVYGDTQGAWVDECSPIGTGRRSARSEADLAWQNWRGDVCVFRLPGIYGPGRSALDRVRDGKANRIDLADQVFSRVHVDDIVSAVRLSFDAPAGVYNIADDEPASQNAVIEHACDLLKTEWPPLQSLEQAQLSPMARGFYAENRRVSNQKAKRLLDWQPTYPNFKQGLAAISVAEGEKRD